jgi:hypothetical protein
LTPGDQRKSLWADPPAHQSERDSDVVARVLPEEPEESSPRTDEPRSIRPLRPRVLAIGVLMGIVIVAVAAAVAGRGSPTVEEVPSFWEDVPMTCKTTRLEQGDRAVELFRCHALRGGPLPPGVYRSPDSRWTSDLNRRDARANAMEITADGELKGWAAY